MNQKPLIKTGRLWIGTAAVVFAASIANSLWGQVPVPPTPDIVKDPVKTTQDTAKDTTKDVQDTAKDATKNAQDTARDASKDAREAAKDATKNARETTQDALRDAQETTRDAARDARGTIRDARETARDATRDARGTIRDARETARDTTQDARDATRDARDATRDLQQDTRGVLRDRRDPNFGGRQAFRGADIGIWFDTGVADGLVIADVDANGAISAAGFREGDRIVSINGQRVINETDFIRMVLDENIRATQIPVIVTRDSQEVTLHIEPLTVRERLQAVNIDPMERFGIVLDDRSNDRLVVWKVLPGSPAFYAGIRTGDVLVNFSGQRVASSREFSDLLTSSRPGMVQLQVERNSRMRQFNVDLPDFRATGEARTALRPNLDTYQDQNVDYGAPVMQDRTYRRAPARRFVPWRARRW